MAAPPNDDLINAELLSGLHGSVHRTNVDATVDTPFDPINATLGGTATVWFKVPVPGTWSETSSKLFFRCRSDGGSISDLWQYIFTMETGATFPPTSFADIDVYAAGEANDEETSLSGITPTDGFIYFGVGALDIQGGFTLYWGLDIPRVAADLPVRIFITDKDSQTLSILDHRSTQRQFLFTLNNPAYHTGQVASDDNEINLPWPDADSPANLTNNRRLLWALQKWEGYFPPYQPIFGGIVTIAEDQGADAPTTRYTAHDPWQYMMSRPVRDPDTGALPGVDGLKFPDGALGSDIALALLETTQAVEGETHILFDTVFDSSPLVGGITFDQGTSVGEAWQQLCNTGTMDITLQPIYDPTVSPGKVCYFNVWPLNEGEAAGNILYDIVMAWDLPGHSLMTINRLVDGTRLANQIQFFAGQGGVPVNLQSDSASVAAYGSYYSQQFFPGTQDRRLVTLLALAELEARKNGGRSITFDPAPERVEQPFKDYNLRDYLPVWASRNLREPLGVDYDSFDANNPGASGYQRIYAIPLNVDDNGVATVTGLLTSKEN